MKLIFISYFFTIKSIKAIVSIISAMFEYRFNSIVVYYNNYYSK